MFSFDSTATLHHVTQLPAGTTFERALKQLHDHDLLIRLDPEFAHYETLPVEEATPNAKRYKVTDHMHALPKGLWDSTVSFVAEMTNTEDGILWVIKAPLGLVQETTWRCLKTEGLADADKGPDAEKCEWSLVEDVEIKANRLLVGTVKGKCEENWKGTHSRFVEHLKKEADS
ncbi:hypothetical protein FB567DRAFT_106199 [Paraphoma chrysanthemicola]|uniref:DUF7053 domain-containing protein n=1 Tax=Paraphoma chrysanthemicola TaxID=798071 RepID=A0A8K0R1S9_9PLEO|nr:hypothetical protein FB567DRAFT_106199 [Paraphoma chrysanthemicola]